MWRMPPAMSEAAKAVGLPAPGWQPHARAAPCGISFVTMCKKELLHLNFSAARVCDEVDEGRDGKNLMPTH